MISKYFNENIFSILNKFKNDIEFPRDFVDFFKYNTGEMGLNFLSSKPKEVKEIGLGLQCNNEIYVYYGVLSIEEFKQQIKFDWQTTGLLKFANNSINEGGYYIGVHESNKGKIFYYENYLEWAEEEEIILLAHSFKDFIENLRPVGLMHKESGIEYKFLSEELDSNGNLISLSVKPITE